MDWFHCCVVGAAPILQIDRSTKGPAPRQFSASTRTTTTTLRVFHVPARSAPVADMMKCVSAGVEMARAPMTPAARSAGWEWAATAALCCVVGVVGACMGS